MRNYYVYAVCLQVCVYVNEIVAGSSSCYQATDLSRFLAHSLSPAYRATRHFNVNGVVFQRCRTRNVLPGPIDDVP